MEIQTVIVYSRKQRTEMQVGEFMVAVKKRVEDVFVRFRS